MSDEQPKPEPTPEEMMRFYEIVLNKPPGSCVGVYDMVPIFEVEDIHSGPKS